MDVNFAISKFSKFFKKYFHYKIKAHLEVSLGKKKQKNKNGKKEIKAKNLQKLPRFQTLTNCFDRYMVIVRIWSSVGQAM